MTERRQRRGIEAVAARGNNSALALGLVGAAMLMMILAVTVVSVIDHMSATAH